MVNACDELKRLIMYFGVGVFALWMIVLWDIHSEQRRERRRERHPRGHPFRGDQW